ncbi:MAG: hypothetical protein IH946_08990, partial [Bacteroidetes bacterium]|nr:hypothetical protein [Bacteroidota bacterium]
NEKLNNNIKIIENEYNNSNQNLIFKNNKKLINENKSNANIAAMKTVLNKVNEQNNPTSLSLQK